MANIKSAKKRILVNRTKADRNKAIKSGVKTSIKKVYAAIEAKDAEIKEANDAKVAAETNAAEKDTKIAELEAENARLKEELSACKKREACEAFDAKLANYSEEEKKCVESEINADEIISKICVNIVANQKKAEADARIAEQNSAKEDDTIDIFSEVNSADEDDNDTNIF